ncbi:uncharacterized protein [Nicotiana sylvestris]|uniref:uncharacterized protein n=1 Tax=Nicotiana sylvestris TaxID=4096 RepID=UPI00388C4473
MELPICYGCGMRGHIQRHCRVSRQGPGRGTAQPASPAVATSSSPSPSRGTPAPAGRGAARGGAQSSRGPSRFYAMSGRQTAEASPDVVTGILTVQSHDVYTLIDPGSTLSYVTPFIAMEFGKEPDQLHEPFLVSTPVGESILATRVYRSCVVTVCGRDTRADLIELVMVDFDAIMVMDWLYSCFAKLDCRTRTMRLEFPNDPAIEWEGDNLVPIGRFISYLKAAKKIKKEYIYHSVRVTDTNDEALSLKSVPVVNEFLNVFPDELPGIPPDREIDFGIDVMPGTQPISIPPYRMAPAELKGLKEQLKVSSGRVYHRGAHQSSFLGHVISEEGIMVDPQKIVTVKNCPRPTTPMEIRSFLDLAGYYRKFVEGFSTLASLLTKLTQKAVKFQWSDTCKKSFQELKSRLTTTPVLTLPEGTEGFVVYCDASRIRLGCVLMQHGKANVVADALSQKSMGSLAHLEACQRPLAREVYQLASLGVLLTDFNEGGVIVQNRAESSLVAEVKEKQFNDPLLAQLKEGIHKNKTTAFSLGMDDGTLRYQDRLCVPDIDDLRGRIMAEAYTSRDLEFKEDDWVFLKVFPMKGIMRFGKKGKLSPRKVVGDLSTIVPVETTEVNEELSYEEVPVVVLDSFNPLSIVVNKSSLKEVYNSFYKGQFSQSLPIMGLYDPFSR